MEFVIAQNIAEKLTEYCRGKLPYEACGVLYGAMENGQLTVDGFIPIVNASSDRANHFRFSTEDWVRAVYQAREAGHTLIGIFHSHPSAEAEPSHEDLKDHWGFLTLSCIISYLIPDKPQIRTFLRQPGQAGFDEISVRFI